MDKNCRVSIDELRRDENSVDVDEDAKRSAQVDDRFMDHEYLGDALSDHEVIELVSGLRSMIPESGVVTLQGAPAIVKAAISLILKIEEVI